MYPHIRESVIDRHYVETLDLIRERSKVKRLNITFLGKRKAQLTFGLDSYYILYNNCDLFWR